MRDTYDAIIIGAGPAGSSAAVLLAEAGWSVALIEKQRFPRRKVCGECLAATNLPLLDELGVGQAFAEMAGPQLKRVALMQADKSVEAPLPRTEDARYPWGRALGREHLDTLLLQRAAQAGAVVLQPWAAQEITGEPGSFQCAARSLQTKEKMTLKAALVIAAYGSWETAPHRHETGCVQRGSDLFAFKANFVHSRLDEGLLPVLSFPGGYGGMVVGNHGITTLACCIRRDRLNECRQQFRKGNAGDSVEAYLRSYCTGVRDALKDAQRQGRWLAAGPIRPGIRMPRNGGDIFMIGNAAGEAHPIIGEGMSMALQSSWLLCSQLIAEPQAAKDAGRQRQVRGDYAKAWHSNFASRIRLAAAFAHLAMRPTVSKTCLYLLQAWPEMMTHAANWCGKVQQPKACLTRRVKDPQAGRANIFQSD